MKGTSCVRFQDPVTFTRKMRHLHLLESRSLGHTVVLENFQELNLGALCPLSEQSKCFEIYRYEYGRYEIITLRFYTSCLQ